MFKSKKFWTLLLAGMLCSSTAFAKPKKVLDLYYACGRVNVSGAAGSGTIIAENDNNYIAMTNRHVVGNSKTCQLTFWPSGKQKSVNGKVVWTRYENGMSIDLALVEISKSQFQGWTPQILKIADYDINLHQNAYIFSLGSPRAYYTLAWNGRVLNVSGATFTFNPTSIGGQSGSSILANVWNKETKEYDTKIVGVLTWSVPSQGGSVGAAQKHQVVLDAIAGRVGYIQPIPDHWEEIETRVTPLESIPDHWEVVPPSPISIDPKVFRTVYQTAFHDGPDMICPYCGQIHHETYIGPCPGGNCPIIGGGGNSPAPESPSPDYPDLTQPPILDGPPKDDDVDKGLLKTIQDSIKSAQDAIRDLQSRVSSLEGNFLGRFRKYIIWGAAGLLALLIVLAIYGKIKSDKGATTGNYRDILKRQIDAGNQSMRREW